MCVIPGEQVIHLMNSRERELEGITRPLLGNDMLFQVGSGAILHERFERQIWQSPHQFERLLLSAIETVNPKLKSTLDAAALCKMAERGQITGGILDGPLAFDTAVSVKAAQIKGLVSPVTGQADILVVPDLESGNMLAKQLEYLGGAQLAGIVLGAKVPVILTSRADSAATRLTSCAVALLLHYANNPMDEN